MTRSNIPILIGLFVVAISFGSIAMWVNGAFAEPFVPEIDQNQVVDEISQTIRVNLHDGISSSDDIR